MINIKKIDDVVTKTGLSRTAIYDMCKTGEFPKQICLKKRSVGWLESDIEDWIIERISLSRNFPVLTVMEGGVR